MDFDCVKCLVSLDADVNAEDSLGKTPLDFAVIKEKFASSSGNDVKMATFENGVALDESLAG